MSTLLVLQPNPDPKQTNTMKLSLPLQWTNQTPTSPSRPPSEPPALTAVNSTDTDSTESTDNRETAENTNTNSSPSPTRPTFALASASASPISVTKPETKLCRTEPLLDPAGQLQWHNPNAADPSLMRWYDTALACFWTPYEIDLARDLPDFKSLTGAEQHLLTVILIFFATADFLVGDNINEQFVVEIQSRELKYFLNFQATMEDIHAQTYGLLLDTFIKDTEQRQHLLSDIQSLPSINRKNKWLLYWTDPSARTFAERLIAFAAVEGIFFSASFCAIFWFKSRGLMPGLCFANELIARDEGLHRDFAVNIHTNLLINRASTVVIHDIIADAVDIEMQYVEEALPIRALPGMNSDMMQQYVKFVADHLLTSLRQPKLYSVENPFPWMDLISLQGKTNFFEKRVSEYALAGASGSNHTFDLDTSF